MTDDFFSDLTGGYDDGGIQEVPPHLLLSAVQYAIRTNMQVVVTLSNEALMGGSVLVPSQVTQILTDAYRSYEAAHGTSVAPDALSVVRPVDLYARGVLHGLEVSLCPQARTAELAELECKEAFAGRPLRREEQARLQRLIDEETDRRGWEDRALRRLAAFTVIRTFIMSDQAGRRLPDSHWSALIGGIVDGMSKGRIKSMQVQRYDQRDADGNLRAVRDADLVQVSVMATKAVVLPSDDDGSFAWALATCERAKAEAGCSPQPSHAIECMSLAYALPLVMVAAKGMFDLACDGDGMSEGEVTRRLASAMYEYATGWNHGSRWQRKAIVRFDEARDVSADLVGVILYGLYWLAGYASEMIGWMWDWKKADNHRNVLVGGHHGDYSLSHVPHANSIRDGYKFGWAAGEGGNVRIHRVTTTAKLRAMEDGFVASALPMIDKFESLAYAALFLYVPAVTPEMPWLLP